MCELYRYSTVQDNEVVRFWNASPEDIGGDYRCECIILGATGNPCAHSNCDDINPWRYRQQLMLLIGCDVMKWNWNVQSSHKICSMSLVWSYLSHFTAFDQFWDWITLWSGDTKQLPCRFPSSLSPFLLSSFFSFLLQVSWRYQCGIISFWIMHYYHICCTQIDWWSLSLPPSSPQKRRIHYHHNHTNILHDELLACLVTTREMGLKFAYLHCGVFGFFLIDDISDSHVRRL